MMSQIQYPIRQSQGITRTSHRSHSGVTFSAISGSTVKSMVGMVGVCSDLHISGVDVWTLVAFTLLLV